MNTFSNIDDVMNTTTVPLCRRAGEDGAAGVLQPLPERHPYRAAAQRDVCLAELAVLLTELQGFDGLQHQQQADGTRRHQLQVRRRVSVWTRERREI